MGSPLPEDYYFHGDYFRLHAKHLKGMESDTSITECVPDSSKTDNVIGDDSILLSALKNDLGECWYSQIMEEHCNFYIWNS